MSNPIFHNSVGTIYNGKIQIKELTLSISDLSSIQFTIIKNGKIDFILIVVSVVLISLALAFHSLLILLISLTISIISQCTIIEYHSLFFGIHKNQEVIVKEINKVDKKDIELFIKYFNIEKGIS